MKKSVIVIALLAILTSCTQQSAFKNVDTKPDAVIDTIENNAENNLAHDSLFITKGMGDLCSSLHECFLFCHDSVGLCNRFCKNNPNHELCIIPQAAEPREWLKDAVTQPLPEGASSVRLILPAELENIDLQQLGAFGAHPGGHAEGLDHEWIWVKDSAPIKSWADGLVVYVNDLDGGSDDTPNVVIYYGDGLWGEHMHVQTSLVKPGQFVKAGDPVAYGEKYQHMPSYHFAEYNIADQHRRDGVGYWYKMVRGATLVSPFDYLRDDVKQVFVEKYTSDIIEHHLIDGKDDSAIIPRPWEPYLTNPILFHEPDKLEGEWFLRSKPWGFDKIPDVIVFHKPSKYYPDQRFIFVDESGLSETKTLFTGDWTADYKQNRFTLKTHDATYYGIFEIDEKEEQAKLTIEFQKESYPNHFSDNALIYTERERISKGEETHYWKYPQDDPRNW